MKSRPNNLLETHRRPASPLGPGQQFRRAFHAQACVFGDGRSLSVRLLYRHVNQAEEFRAAVMSAQSDTFEGVIPADHTNSPFPIQYYFELRDGKGQGWLYPGLGPDLDQRPYYVVRQMRKSPS